MISYAEALGLVLHHARPLGAIALPLADCLGLALAEDLAAGEDIPPFDNSAMDGYALRAGDARGAPLRLEVCGGLGAGQVAPALPPGAALRIMTGAPVPAGADTVVPQEDTRSGDGWVELLRPPAPGANIRRAGEDIPRGAAVGRAGRALRPADIGVLASLGFGAVPVRPRVRVAVLTTGNELVDAGERPGPGRIRDANIHAVGAQVAACGGLPLPFPRIPDAPGRVEETLRRALAGADVILTTGGVSVGDYDFVKPALEALGAERVFWKVAQKPGQPLGLWAWEGRPVFGLPGNPVAAMLMVEEFVRPLLRRMMGFQDLFRPEAEAVLVEGYRKGRADGRVNLLRVVAREEAGVLRARLTGPQGSGILSSMMKANAVALVPAEAESVPEGGTVRVHLTEQPEDH